jgi:hypothetical protein
MSIEYQSNRRKFLRASAIAGMALAAGLSARIPEASAHPITNGDIAVLKFFSAIEILETDLWQQYNELGGIQDKRILASFTRRLRFRPPRACGVQQLRQLPP